MGRDKMARSRQVPYIPSLDGEGDQVVDHKPDLSSAVYIGPDNIVYETEAHARFIQQVTAVELKDIPKVVLNYSDLCKQSFPDYVRQRVEWAQEYLQQLSGLGKAVGLADETEKVMGELEKMLERFPEERAMPKGCKGLKSMREQKLDCYKTSHGH